MNPRDWKCGDLYGAELDKQRLYRWSLGRGGCGWIACFIGLNPSTADEYKDDPTIRRCMGFARSWECTGLLVVNLYGWRATDPAGLAEADDPVGTDNDDVIDRAVRRADIVVAAWGASLPKRKVSGLDRAREITNRYGGRLECLGLTKHGHPRHPSRAPAGAKRLVFPGYG